MGIKAKNGWKDRANCYISHSFECVILSNEINCFDKAPMFLKYVLSRSQ